VNLLLFDDDDFLSPTHARVAGRRAAHVIEVHRARPGDELRVGRIDGPVGRGVVVSCSADRVDVEVTLDAEPPPPLPLRLLLALPRPKSLKKVLQAVSAMGVKEIVLLNTWRVEKSFWDSPVLQPTELREQLILGLEQGCDTQLPRIELRRRFKPFVQDELPALAAGSLALVAHPPAAAECPRAVTRPVTLAIGPEGGFIPFEVEFLEEHGFVAVSLGPRPLRVEHAVPALLGRLF